ncbi:MAG: ATP-binding protein [Pseudonocardiaceae bacterium]
MRNEVSGTVAGPVVLARSVYGGVHVHQPTWEAMLPRQLPGAVRHFTGRTDELEALNALLDNAGAGGTVVISAIDGTAGIGKTALAIYWAHQVVQRFPDGHLYVNLRGFDPTGSPVEPAAAIQGFLDAFAVPVDRIPVSPEAQAALYRSLLAERRMLVVLDNARDVDQVRPLLPGSRTCFVVVTSRSQLSGLVATEGAHLQTLDLFTVSVARELLTRHLGAERIAGEAEVVDELIKLCARLPLALAIVGARASERPGFPLEVLLAQLRDTRGRLDALDGGDLATDVRAVFSWSYHYLSAGAARMFRLMGVHPGPDISVPAAASLVGIPLRQARKALDELTHARMITEHAPSRFAFHDLLRAYATDLAHTIEGDAERRAAMHRVLDHYLHSAHTAALLLHSTRDPLTLAPPQPGVIPEDLAEGIQALIWFEAEHPVMLAAIGHAADTGFETYAWQIPWTLATFFDRRGHWHDWASTQHIALAAAERMDHQDGQARAHRLLGRAYIRLGSSEKAEIHLRRALDLYQQLGNRVGLAHAHYDLASVFGQQGRADEALGQVQEALGLYEATNHEVGQARALNAIGWYSALLGDHYQALTFCDQALILCRKLGDRLCEGGTLDSLGYVHQYLGHYTQALACYQQAIEVWQELGNYYYQATTLTHLGETYHAAGDREAACNTWQHALAILDDLHHPDADQVRGKLHHMETT